MPEVLDARWIDDYRALSSYPSSVGSLLRSKNASRQKTAFIKDGFRTNPVLTPKVDNQKLATSQVALRLFREKIEDQEDERLVKDAYLPRLAELETHLSMLEASAKGDTAGFVKANVEAYGEPEKPIFNLILKFFHEYMGEHLESSSPAVRAMALQLQASLPEPQKTRRVWPDETKFKKVRNLHQEFFEEILEGIELPEEFGSEVSFPATRKAIKNLGYDKYKVEAQAAGISTMAVDHDPARAKVPKDERYTRQRFIGLLGHEIKIHIAERLNGEQQPLQILYSGLEKYLRGSEGKGVLIEQIVYDSFEDFMATRRFFDIARRYLSVGLARGIDGNGERDFSEVFKIMNAIDQLDETIKDPTNLAAATVKSIDRTWELLAMRTMRGYTGRGAAAHRDKVYPEGNLDQWVTLARVPEVFPYLNVGKWDAHNKEHARILGGIGSVPTKVVTKLISR